MNRQASPHEILPTGDVDLLLEAIDRSFVEAVTHHGRVRDVFSSPDEKAAAAQWEAWRRELFNWWNSYRSKPTLEVYWDYESPVTGRVYSDLYPRMGSLTYALLKRELGLAWSSKILTELKVYKILGPGSDDIEFDVYQYPKGTYVERPVKASKMAIRVVLAYLKYH